MQAIATNALKYDVENRLVKVCEDTSNNAACNAGEPVIATFTYACPEFIEGTVMASGSKPWKGPSTGSGTTTTTLFVGAHDEVNSTTNQVTKYYFAGAARIAARKYTIPPFLST